MNLKSDLGKPTTALAHTQARGSSLLRRTGSSPRMDSGPTAACLKAVAPTNPTVT